MPIQNAAITVNLVALVGTNEQDQIGRSGFLVMFRRPSMLRFPAGCRFDARGRGADVRLSPSSPQKSLITKNSF